MFLLISHKYLCFFNQKWKYPSKKQFVVGSWSWSVCHPQDDKLAAGWIFLSPFFTHYYNAISDTKLIFFMVVFFNKLLIVYFWGVYYFQIRLFYFWFCWLPLKTATAEREVLKCGYFTLVVIAIIDLLQRCATVLNCTFLLYIFKFLGTVFCEDNS